MKVDATLRFTDIHCHLLPGVDDGPRDWEMTLVMARLAVAEGIDTIIATPHQLGRYELNTAEQIRRLANEAQRRISEAGVKLTVLPGADVRIREDLPELIHQDKVLTLADRRTHVLLELPEDQFIPSGKLLYRLESEGICGILSHPERNRVLQHNPDLLRPWVQQGGLVQVTAASLTGQFGPPARRTGRWLLLQGLVHLIATDAHDVKYRPPRVGDAFRKVRRWLGAGEATRLFVDNPRALVCGKKIGVPLPISRARGPVADWWQRISNTLSGAPV